MRRSQDRVRAAGRVSLAVALAACSAAKPDARGRPDDAGFTGDGRQPVTRLFRTFGALAGERGWIEETVYAYPDEAGLAIRAWRTPQAGPALWLISGIHGEEPAGPNAIAAGLARIEEFASAGVPVVLVPLCNPKAYRNNWRYPNTADRDWKGGGYSVGDSEFVLPDLESGSRPRQPNPPGPESRALATFALRMAHDYPPRLVLDLHEDELSKTGGYVYSQGVPATSGPIAARIVHLLIDRGIPLRLDGLTRFGEPVVGGVVSQDERGRPLRDGSIDELLSSATVFVDGAARRGPSAPAVIVVETPTFEGARLAERVAAHKAVVDSIGTLWALGR